MFERILSFFEATPSQTELPPAEAKYALGALLVRTAMADNAYLFQEVEEIDRVLAKLNNLNALDAAKMRAQCEKLEESLPETRELAEILTRSIKQSEREAVLSALWSVVYSDGNRHDREDAFVSEMEELLGVDKQTCQLIRDREIARHPPSGG